MLSPNIRTGFTSKVRIMKKNKAIKTASAPDKKIKSWADFKTKNKEKPSSITLIQNEFDKTEWTW